MSKLYKWVAISLLVVTPFIGLQAEEKQEEEKLFTGSAEVGITLDNRNFEKLEESLDGDNVRLDAYGEGSLNLDFLSVDMEARIEEALNEVDEDVDEERFWETVEELAIRGDLLISIKGGKLNANVGAAESGVGESRIARPRDSAMSQTSQRYESVQGIQFSSLDKFPSSQKAVDILNQALSGVTVTFYTPDTGEKIEVDNYDPEDMKGFAIQKTGEIESLGLKYQASAVDADTAAGEDSVQSLSLEKCGMSSWNICAYGEYQRFKDSEISPLDNQVMVGVGTVLKSESKWLNGMDLSAEYTTAEAKDEAMDAIVSETVGLNISKSINSWEHSASLQHDLDSDDDTVFYRANYVFD